MSARRRTAQQRAHVGRRSEDLPVRRWLTLAAASAGLGAALAGWSLAGPDTGVAAADTGAASSSSAGPAAHPSKRAPARDTPVPKASADRHATSAPSGTAKRATAPEAAAPPVVIAGRGDPLNALGSLFTSAIKEALARKTTFNPIQKLDDLTPKGPSLLDRIPKIPVHEQHDTWKREVQQRNRESQQAADEKSRQIDDIIRTGQKLTATDGTPVYTTDGKTFVTYRSVFLNGPLEPNLIRLDRPRPPGQSDQQYDENTDRIIRNNVRLDPAFVRSLWGRPPQDPGGGAS
jgi:hypothetical protein